MPRTVIAREVELVLRHISCDFCENLPAISPSAVGATPVSMPLVPLIASRRPPVDHAMWIWKEQQRQAGTTVRNLSTGRKGLRGEVVGRGGKPGRALFFMGA